MKTSQFARVVSFVVLTTFTGSISGCATWWQNFKADPVAQTQSILSTISTIVSVATMVFGQVKAQLPAADQATAQDAFDKAVLAVQHSEGLIQQAVQTAADQKQGLDLSALYADAWKAVEQLKAMVDALKGHQGTIGASAQAQQDASKSELDLQIGVLRQQMAR